MHHAHTARPQHIRHHVHQPPIHPQRPPPLGMTVGHQIRAPQHHISNVPPPGGHQQISAYIPPHQRESNRLAHHQPRLNSQLHSHHIQSKFRPGNNRNVGFAGSSPNQQQQQQQNTQPSHVTAQPHIVQQQHMTQQTHVSQQQPRMTQQSHIPQQCHPPPQPHIPHQSPNPSTDLQSKSQKSPVTSQQPISAQQSITAKQTVSTTQQVKTQQIIPPQQGISSQQSVSVQSLTAQQTVTKVSTVPTQQTGPQSKHIPLKSIVTKSVIHQPPLQSQMTQQIRPTHSQQALYMPPPNKPYKSPQLQRAPISQQPINSRPHNPPPPRPPPPQKVQNQIPTSPNPSLTPNLHQQQKSAQNITNVSTTVNSVSNPSVPLVQTEQLQASLQNLATIVDSRSTKIIDSQQKTQITQQNSNHAVSTTQHEIKSELVCENSLDSSSNEGLANTKEKTPMCLVNELARFNKIQHQYRLTGEQGPAHCKRFTVTLKLGEEEYTAEGPSIKKAQHSAAADAISKTKYQHPPAKTTRLKNGRTGIGNITPTVELNALAMKLGEPTVYVFDTPPPSNAISPNIIPPTSNIPHQILGQSSSQQQANFAMPVQNQTYIQDGQYQTCGRNGNTNMYTPPRYQGISRRPFNRGFMKYNSHRFLPPFNGAPTGITKGPCKITLIVGKHKFVGVGPTVQMAKHDAAARALEVLKPLAESETSNDGHSTNTDDPSADLKSPISLVHETALKRNLTVSFEVKSERGPPHMKTFVTLCKVGNMVTEGEGNGKKISKKRAAEKMLEELKKLPPLTPSKTNSNVVKIKTLKRKSQIIKKKARNLIKESSEPETPEEINPISKLIQIQQALKEREPIYTLIEEKGAPRRREFVIEVAAGGQIARGTGSSKKMAKKVAARNLLTLMGYESSSMGNVITLEISKTSKCIDNKIKHSYQENGETHAPSSNQGGTCGRQIVPGLLLMQQKKKSQYNQSIKENTSSSSPAKEDHTSNSGKITEKPSLAPNISSEGIRSKDQLLYLAQLLGFQAVFSDYPKGNHGEYLTIVTLSTDPPQICHGAGCDTEASQDKASRTALQILTELGLDNVKPLKPQEEKKMESVLTENSKE